MAKAHDPERGSALRPFGRWGMRKKLTAKLVVAIGILGIAVPLLAALYLAHSQSMEAEMRLADTMVGEVLRRTDAAGDQARAAYERLRSAPYSETCSDQRIALMRDIDMASGYLQLLGSVTDGRLTCSSLGRHDPPIALGPVEWVSALGAGIRRSVDLGIGDGHRFLTLQKDDIVTAMHPESLIDIFVDREDIALGAYGRSGARLLSSRGYFDSRWMKHLGDAEQARFFDGRYLVSLRASTRFDTAAYVAVPADYLRSRLYRVAFLLVPIALVLGAGLSFGVVKLAQQRSSLRTELRLALKRSEFELHYQPILELATRRIVGVEALLRWPRREGETLRPDVFIPAAEDYGLVRQFTEYVLARVALDAPHLLKIRPDCYVSVNLASSDLHSGMIVESLRRLLQTNGIAPANLVVEATEHSFLDPVLARRIVTAIRELGVRVAIDDFGTGYSSLPYLTSLQTDYLKIDKVFVETVGTDSATSEVALHIIRIAESLGLKVIGEGVETEVQAAFLRDHGVQFAQGWLFHKALPIEQLLALLRAQAKA